MYLENQLLLILRTRGSIQEFGFLKIDKYDNFSFYFLSTFEPLKIYRYN
jgi:hypothetical protein